MAGKTTIDYSQEFGEIVAGEIRLFDGIPLEKRLHVLKCVNARILHFGKGSSLKEALIKPGSTQYLIKGRARIMRIDECGERTILCDCDPDAPLFSSDVPTVFSSREMQIVALENCSVIEFSIPKEIEGRACCMVHVGRMRNNVVQGLNGLNALLLKHLDIVSRRTIRSKICAYLTWQAERAGKRSFDIQMKRQDLADYLCVERSALSRELGKMRDEELISCEKGSFVILDEAVFLG